MKLICEVAQEGEAPVLSALLAHAEQERRLKVGTARRDSDPKFVSPYQALELWWALIARPDLAPDEHLEALEVLIELAAEDPPAEDSTSLMLLIAADTAGTCELLRLMGSHLEQPGYPADDDGCEAVELLLAADREGECDNLRLILSADISSSLQALEH